MNRDIGMEIRRSVFCFLVVAVSLPLTGAEPLRMENALPIAPARSGAPIYLRGELQYDLPGILEGRLRFVLRDGSTVIDSVETDPMVVVTGINRFRQSIPVSDRSVGYGVSDIVVSFVTDERTIRLGEIGVRLAQQGSWETIVLCAEPTPGAGLGKARSLQAAVMFGEAFQDSGEFGIQNYIPTVAASELPEQPLALCSTDLILLPSDAFLRLSIRQLDAIKRWTRAGGALCVQIDAPLEQKQVSFLEELFTATSVGPFVRDDDGILIEPSGTVDSLFTRRAGLGMAVVAFGPADEINFDGPEWREAHARLWRLREELVRTRRSGHKLDLARVRHASMGQSNQQPSDAIYGSIDASQFWGFPTPAFGTAIVEALKPENIQLIPGWVISLILLGYVIVVGPVEYVVLGWLKMRKWTWLTFPAMTLLLTATVVGATNSFMSANDHRRRVEIVDLDASGVPVRSTTLELLFRGSSEPTMHEVSGAWFASLNSSYFQSMNQFGQVTTVGNNASTGPYIGSLTSRYVVPQRLAKWTPQVNRTFKIAPEVAVPQIDWERIARDSSSTLMLPGGQWASITRIADGQETGFGGTLGRLMDSGSYVWQNGRMVPPQSNLTFLGATTAGPVRERFSVQFQRSPLGLGRLDDLPFIDMSDQNAVATIVAIEDTQGNITVFRKLVEKPE